jgi:16S rRNA (adenine1518-N6/adenine1519-N6)-dimethyltransferase
MAGKVNQTAARGSDFRRSRRRALGQHFLSSAGVLEKIVAVIDPGENDLIVEIGPGKGALTFPLAERAGKVIAVEKDRRLAVLLEQKRLPNLVVLAADILDVRFQTLVQGCAHSGERVQLVGNLPYSISSPLLFKIIDEGEVFERCVFLVQKEVAQRVTAKPGSKDFSPLSIVLQLEYDAVLHFTVAPGSFSPPPRVESAVISLAKRPSPLYPIRDLRLFLEFLRSAFRQRRKTLANNLAAAGMPSGLIRQGLQKLTLADKIRSEQLTIEQFVRLFEFFRPGQTNV